MMYAFFSEQPALQSRESQERPGAFLREWHPYGVRFLPAGVQRKRRAQVTEFGRELQEKQKLQRQYNLRERQFKNYVRKVLGQKGREDAENMLISMLERRLDNVVFRFGIAATREQARQMVSHGFFLVNGTSIDIPSAQVRKGDVISVKPQKKEKGVFKDLALRMKNYKFPSWLVFDAAKMEGKVTGDPAIEEVQPPVEVSTVFEYYSR